MLKKVTPSEPACGRQGGFTISFKTFVFDYAQTDVLYFVILEMC